MTAVSDVGMRFDGYDEFISGTEIKRRMNIIESCLTMILSGPYGTKLNKDPYTKTMQFFMINYQVL